MLEDKKMNINMDLLKKIIDKTEDCEDKRLVKGVLGMRKAVTQFFNTCEEYDFTNETVRDLIKLLNGFYEENLDKTKFVLPSIYQPYKSVIDFKDGITAYNKKKNETV